MGDALLKNFQEMCFIIKDYDIKQEMSENVKREVSYLRENMDSYMGIQRGDFVEVRCGNLKGHRGFVISVCERQDGQIPCVVLEMKTTSRRISNQPKTNLTVVYKKEALRKAWIRQQKINAIEEFIESVAKKKPSAASKIRALLYRKMRESNVL